MKRNKTTRLYTIILPIWLLIWFPTWLWLILIPVNYLIDFMVTYLSMKKLGIEDCKQKTLKHSWKICLIGFFSDFVGVVFLLGVLYLTDIILPKEIGEPSPMGCHGNRTCIPFLSFLLLLQYPEY